MQTIEAELTGQAQKEAKVEPQQHWRHAIPEPHPLKSGRGGYPLVQAADREPSGVIGGRGPRLRQHGVSEELLLEIVHITGVIPAVRRDAGHGGDLRRTEENADQKYHGKKDEINSMDSHVFQDLDLTKIIG